MKQTAASEDISRMYEFVRCYTCGRCLGSYSRVFNEMRKRYFLEFADKKHDGDRIMPEADLSAIFAQLKVHNICCRARLMAQERMANYLEA